MNPAYRHLEEPVKVGDFTLLQIAGFLTAALFGILWVAILSPLPPMWSLFTGVYIAGLPAMVVFFASTTDFDVLRMVKAYIRFQRRPGRFTPGPGPADGCGYRVNQPPARHDHDTTIQFDEIQIGDALWQD